MENQLPIKEQIQLDFIPNRVATSILKAESCALFIGGPETKNHIPRFAPVFLAQSNRLDRKFIY
jgi:hypothetical protein